MSQVCRFGYTSSSCANKFEPPCGGNCEFPSQSIHNVKPRSYNDVNRNK